ncbi:hypothetical protein BGX34_011632 [Mortierella sp. NVP85]|nr:hypothetical protein BGX34_011632 [Mortierella sp. NVP85]
MAMNTGTVTLKNSTELQIRAVGEASQQACASIAQPFVPNIVALSLKEILPAVLGIVILGIFGSRRELWRDLKTWWLEGRRARRRLWCGRATDLSEMEEDDDRKDQQDGYPGIHGDLTNAMSALVTRDDDSSYYGQNFRPKNLVLLPPLDISPSTTNPRDPNPLHLIVRTGSINNRGVSLPISGVYNRYSDTGSDADSQVVVGEASRVLLNYRSNDDTRPQIVTIDPTIDQQEPEQQEQQQSEQQPQRSLSPAPRKSQL